MERVILHADLNNFYASVECLHRPELREVPMVVGGNEAVRHGIVLAKNYPAKALGIKTGETIWQIRRRWPQVVVIPADFALYWRFSRLVKAIFGEYSDQVESFGIDESWIDITGSLHGQRSGQQIADELRQRIKEELGITASVGVSWNKIFAKLGSDLHKPDATTVISRENYQAVVWPLPVDALLYVGRATAAKLKDRSIRTIGDLAQTEPQELRRTLGKWGEMLWGFANGYDSEPVAGWEDVALIKSIGNSVTAPRDLQNRNDVQMVLTVLADSVAMRLRQNGLKSGGIAIQLRDDHLGVLMRQMKLPQAIQRADLLIQSAMALFDRHYTWERPLRSLGIKAFDLQPAVGRQLTLFADREQVKKERLERTLDELRCRFGNKSIVRANTLQDPALTAFDPMVEHTIHPVSYFK